jgi:PEGA domain
MTTKAKTPVLFALVLALVGAVIGAGARPCHAAEDRKTLLELGRAQRLVGDENQALIYFQRAHQIAATPESFAMMGASEFGLNRLVDAEVHLSQALGAANDPWIKRNRVLLSQYLASTKALLGWIEVVGTPNGAEVEVAGRPAGRLPLPGRVRVPSGEVNVRVEAHGFKVGRRDIDVASDQVARVEINLEPLAPGQSNPQPGPPVAGRGRVPGGGRSAAGAGGSRAAPIKISAASGNGYRTAGWLTAGASVLLAGTGVAALIVRDGAARDFNTYRGEGNVECNVPAANAGGMACKGYLDREKTARTLAIVSLAGATAVGIVSGVLWAVASNQNNEPNIDISHSAGGELVAAKTRAAVKSRQTATRWACVPSLTELGGACAFSF